MTPDVLILGGGIIGLAIALELKLQGASVTVLSRNFAEAATQAAAGMLAPQAEQIPPGPNAGLVPPQPRPLSRLDTEAGGADWVGYGVLELRNFGPGVWGRGAGEQGGQGSKT